MKQEKLYEKTIYDLFYIKLNKRYHLRDNYVNLSEYEKNIKSNVKNININCNEKFIKDKYAYYIKVFERLKNGENIRITLTNIGFYSRYNTKKEYYIDRGWDNVAIDTFIKQRQSRQLSQESKKKWTETWHNNREKNIVSLKKGNVICKDYYKEKLSNNEWKNWLNPVTKKTADECYSFDMHKLSLLSERNLIYDIVWDTDCVNKKIKEITSKITKLYESKQK